MGTSREDSERYRRSVSNPFAGADPLGAIRSAYQRGAAVQPPNPFMEILKAARQNADPRVLFDVPAAGRQIGAQLEQGGRDIQTINNYNPLAMAFNALPAVGTALGLDPSSAGPAIGRGTPYRMPVFGGRSTSPSADPMGGAGVGAPGPGRPSMGNSPFGTGASDMSAFRSAIVQQESRGNYTARNRDTGALGAYQVMPATGQTLAKRMGLAWQPGLMTSDTPEGRAYQDRIGGAAVKEAYDYGGGDISKAAMYYHGGSNTDIWGPKTRQYAQEVGARLGAGGDSGFQSPFNAADWQPGLEANRAAGAIAAKPWSTKVAMPDAPAFPDAPAMPKPDFSATDAQLEQLRPVMMDEVKQKRIRQGMLWQAAAQGLAATPENAHWGKVLANVGAGLLAGKVAGDQEIQRRVDAFDEKMAAFEMMQFKYADQKQSTMYQSAMKDFEFTYDYNMKKFAYTADRFDKDWSFNVRPDGSVVSTSKVDGGRQVTYTPNANAVMAQTLQGEAEIQTRIATAAQQGASQVASAVNGMRGQVLAHALQLQTAQEMGAGQADAGTRSFMASADLQAQELVRNGLAPELIGADRWADASKGAQQEALTMGLTPGSKEYGEYVQRKLGTSVMELMLTNPQFRARVQTKLPTLWELRQNREREDLKTTRKTDSRGRSSVTEVF